MGLALVKDQEQQLQASKLAIPKRITDTRGSDFLVTDRNRDGYTVRTIRGGPQFIENSKVNPDKTVW